MKQVNLLEYVPNHELSLGLQIEIQQREQEGYDLSGLRLDVKTCAVYPDRVSTSCIVSCLKRRCGTITPTRNQVVWTRSCRPVPGDAAIPRW